MKLKIFFSWFMIFVFLCPCAAAETSAQAKDESIKWVDFTVPAEMMKKALQLDTKSYEAKSDIRLHWIELLAYLAAKNGGDFKKTKTTDLDKLAETLSAGETIENLTRELKYYKYYHTVYTAVLGGLAGEYETGTTQQDGSILWEQHYGQRAYAPLAKGYDFSHFDDFGSGRSYGYKRKHLGHDLMALTGTPVIATESGVIEEIGWNQYGGWRIGIRSFDGLRYWYYAHLRQNRPYAEGLEKGQVVMAGDVIGYVGRTGYSSKENQNNIKQSHLHWGLQLVFDESQKDSGNQIWINLYEIAKLLMSRRSETVRNPDTKEHTRLYPYREPVPEDRFQPPEPIDPSPPSESTAEDAQAAENAPMHKKDSRETVSLPVIMYHGILKNPSRHGKYIIYPQEFEDDIHWLYHNGYQSVGIREILDYVENGVMLPEKPVLLTFDDGHYNNVFYAEPILEKYQMKAVMFAVGEFCDKTQTEGGENPNFSYIAWSELTRMQHSGIWDIQNHTYRLHQNKNGKNGVARIRGESEEAYRARLREDFDEMTRRIAECTGETPLAFAYPFGQMSETADQILSELGCKMTFSCTDGVAELRRGDPMCLSRIKRRLRAPGRPVGQLVQ